MAISPRKQAVSPEGRQTPSALALLRFMSGLSQRELAERAGVSKRTIINLEHARNEPRISTATAISACFGLDDPRVVFPLSFQPHNEKGAASGNATPSDSPRQRRPNGSYST